MDGVAYSEKPLNPFSLLSYGNAQLEKFHSRVIAGLLDGRQHAMGAVILDLFLDLLLKKSTNNRLKKNIASFRDEVGRDHADIQLEYALEGEGTTRFADIVIFTVDRRRAIIVENKVNNAPDLVRQIPFYISAIQGKGCDVVAVVYLKVKDPGGFPCTDRWSEKEIALTRRLIVPLSACNSTDELSLSRALFEPLLSRNDMDDSGKNVVRQYMEFLSSGIRVEDTIRQRFAEVFSMDSDANTAEVKMNLLRQLANLIVDKGSCMGFGKGKVNDEIAWLWDFWLVIDDNYKVELAFDLNFDAESGVGLSLFVRTDCRRILRNSLHGINSLFSDVGVAPILKHRQKRGQWLQWEYSALQLSELDSVIGQCEKIISCVCNGRESIVDFVRGKMDAIPS